MGFDRAGQGWTLNLQGADYAAICQPRADGSRADVWDQFQGAARSDKMKICGIVIR
jgi:hypothetical protein